MEDDAPAPIPVNLLLQIAARSDPVTLVRCAAACRALRDAVAAPAFLRGGLRLRHAAEGRFVPTLLRGFFHQRRDRAEGEDPQLVDPWLPRGVPSPEPFRSFLSENTDLFEFYEPAAARGGLIALRSGSPDDAGVCDPMTGFLDFLGRPEIGAQSYVLLTDDCDGIGCRFRLLAANLQSSLSTADGACCCCCLQTQAYSSDEAGAWGAITETWVPGLPWGAKFVRPDALVLDGVAHWLCRSSDHQKYFVLTFSAGEASTTVTVIRAEEDDDDGRCRRLHGCKPKELLLVSSVEGRVSLLVAEQGLEISLWTAPHAADSGGIWTRQVVVDAEKARQAVAPRELPLSGRHELRWFGEKSGGVLTRLADPAVPVRGRFSNFSFYFMLEIVARRVRMVCRLRDSNVHMLFPYEMGLSFWLPKITPSIMQ
ncbi:hypothetical protein BAE44_0009744 [Dichanthelium oligosanthes]|uniref:DUF7595 domain-containing protein n=1 Tax=Dichanthelium oligosanthes TaxID=888268 RepID=A0A1E5VVX6_9POAL|nr:hypothetical protein BAE44_0009744 [Dichanthelium oligosanthes]